MMPDTLPVYPSLHPSLSTSSGDFIQIRSHTESICSPLAIEDHVVQPAPFISPPKWHLAHTSWFFDRFLLEPAGQGVAPGDSYHLMFNSYYKSQGAHWRQADRGCLSRPTVSEVMSYRQQVTEKVTELIRSGRATDSQQRIIALGVQHEKQHQELLLMDIKYIFAFHPQPLVYDRHSIPSGIDLSMPAHWVNFDEGLQQFGAPADHFAYDNERPRHPRWLCAFQLCSGLVTNEEYLRFIDDGAYRDPSLWLSDGWDWLQEQGTEHPLYWFRQEGAWQEYHAGGREDLALSLPVSHISYYEADAYARWAGARLPTEFELEHFLNNIPEPENSSRRGSHAFWKPGAAICPHPSRAADKYGNGLLWQWTQSPYTPFPGFTPEPGSVSEYNGKFMSGQYVLRGGCVATPEGHSRPSYRNFYRPLDRWAFTGIRLARDS
ncbi:MAG: ergothioneine biosynthesis protein EgtB [Pseudohongiellaceae bacterium]